MSIRFILGRAGSGKTHYCLAAVRARLQEDRLDGTHAILLVPEQASLQMERELIEDPAIGAFSRAEVLSFRRLAMRVLSQAGGLGDSTLTPLGRLMVLRHLLERDQKHLRCYGPVLNKRGFVAELAAAIVELMHEQVAPAMLRETLGGLPADSASAHKVHDVARVYQAYRDYLTDGPADPERYLDLAAGRLGECAWLQGGEVWVDGFAGFTRQEMSLLVELGRLSGRLEVALLLDPADLEDPAAEDPLSSFGLFAATQRTFAELRQRFAAAELSVDPPLLLTPRPPPRFASSKTLACLERSVFKAGGAAPARHSGVTPEVELYAFPNRRLEVEAALCRVQDLVRREKDPLRYRDIALIMRDVGLYHDLISAGCEERQIPVFVDRRQPVSHHPLVELMRALCLLGAQDFSREAVSLLIKTGLVPIEDHRLDALENFVIAYGISGSALWTRREWGYWDQPTGKSGPKALSKQQQARIRRLNETRRQLLRALGPWADLCTGRVRQTGSAWVSALEEVLSSLGVRQRLEAWRIEAEEDGRPAEAMEHHQVWTEAGGVLQDLREGLGQAEMDMAQFGDILGTGLGELTLGLAPPTLDQLLVGTIERSRHPALRAVLLLGFNERVFPRAPAEPCILNDEDRQALAEACPREAGRPILRLGSTGRQRFSEERFLGYVALTRASQSLWISYAAADEQGKELFASPFVGEVQGASPGLSVRQVGDPQETRRAELVGSAAALAGRLAGEFGGRPPFSVDPDKAAQRGNWNRLYAECLKDDTLAPALGRALTSLAHVNEAALDADAVDSLYRGALRNSVTRLECFASCPFRHFAEYGLGLDQRLEHRLEALELGTLSHQVIEEFVREIMAEAATLHELDQVTVERRLKELAAGAADELHDELLLAEARRDQVPPPGRRVGLRAAREGFAAGPGVAHPQGAPPGIVRAHRPGGSGRASARVPGRRHGLQAPP